MIKFTTLPRNIILSQPVIDPILISQKRYFYEPYKHGPQAISNPKFPSGKAIREIFTKGNFKDVCQRIKTNIVKSFEYGDVFHREPGKPYIFEHFDSDESIKAWRPLADSDSLNGFSIAKISRSQAGHALFHGVLDTRIPDDGLTQQSGMVALAGPQNIPSSPFKREGHWNWSRYNSIQIRFRGDGRRYALVVNDSSYMWDLHYYRYFLYALHTKGGPYWQTRTIPFSKFIRSFKGFVQDDQPGFDPTSIKNLNIRLSDSYPGPFSLEIDYIALVNDTLPFEEKTPYEGYVFPHIKYKDIQPGCQPPDRE